MSLKVGKTHYTVNTLLKIIKLILCTYISGTGKDLAKSLNGIKSLVSDVIEDMLKHHEKVPEPLSKKEYSGRFVIRITPERHRELAIKAQEQGVSLNHYAATRLYG